MAIVHISEVEAARDLAGLLAKVRAGEDIRIASGSETFTIVPAEAVPVKLRSASEILASLKKRGSTVTLPPGFADDVEEGIRSHEHETLRNPWE